jgi:protein-S-isoprenylcysteine O-methyltransferase Ste14
MTLTAWQLTNASWILLGIYWVFLSMYVKRPARQESSGAYLAHIAVMCVSFFLLFSRAASVGFLGARFVADVDWMGWAGLGLTIAGCGIAAWARWYLGTNWSAVVTVREGHELIRNGPYAVVRHPIYWGLLVAMMGTAIEVGEVRGLVGVAIAFFAWWDKTRREETFLVEQFEGEYVQYRRMVKRLIPFIF